MKRRHYLILALLIFFYLALTLFKLTKLPVFADESIYIRWTQLIIDDWQQYLFYPMNDGKTPLQMWLMLPWQFVFKNQLFAGRFLSVLVGLGNVFTLAAIAKKLSPQKNNRQLQYLTIFLASILPITFFHHRVALTDALLFLNLALSYYFAIRYVKDKKKIDLILLSLSFALALMSKLSAFLFLPAIASTVLFDKKLKFKKIIFSGFGLGFAIMFAVALFYLLRFNPLFPQLFSRGGDFLYPFEILLSASLWPVLGKNLQFFAEQYWSYFGPIVLFLAVAITKKNKQEKLALFLGFLSFVLPLAMLGKVIYPRYLFPSSIFLIISASLSLDHIFNKRILLGYGILIAIITFSLRFIWPSYFNPDQIPFSLLDREQYLEEWSSGHGILESTQLMLQHKEKHSLAVATEGFFGTLPDGILMYLHRQDVNRLLVEGIGQPVSSIPTSFKEKAQNYEQVWLIVNSHRLNLDLAAEKLITEYCRPNSAPCLQIWDISDFLKN